MYGAISYDILPYTSYDTKDTLIRKLLFDSSSTDFQYFMIDQIYVQEGNFSTSEIVNDLTNMVYTASSSTTDQITKVK